MPEMIELLVSALIASNYSSEQVNKFCSQIVGISYASDTFTDDEWQRFEYCRKQLKIESD